MDCRVEPVRAHQVVEVHISLSVARARQLMTALGLVPDLLHLRQWPQTDSTAFASELRYRLRDALETDGTRPTGVGWHGVGS